MTAGDAGPREVEPWTLLRERAITTGWIPLTSRTYRMPDGSVSDWEIHTPGFTTVAVLAFTDDDRIVATRQYRPGPAEIVIDPPGGIVDAGEEILDAARRELLEETGYTCESMHLLGSSWAFGSSTWRRHVAMARGCRFAREPTSWGGDEYCAPVLLTIDELRSVAREGRTTDVDLIYLGLDAAGLL